MKKWGILLGAAIIIVIAVCVGVSIFNMNNKPKNQINNTSTNNETILNQVNYSVKNDITVNTGTNEEKISPNATLILKRKYKECGHIIKEYKRITDDLVNLTEKELIEKSKEWEIEEFSNMEVVLIKEVEGVCNEHYVLREKDGVIAVYKIDKDTKEELEELTGISIEYLTENDKMEIQQGIMVYGKEELNSILENYE
ncbi:MAG: hypothetical protein HFJ58_06850 [Clostridia bacterium]|nr:hypothetical protein [Clostridia bacterium]